MPDTIVLDRPLRWQEIAAVAKGAAIIRVHDVAETVQALKIAAAIERAR